MKVTAFWGQKLGLDLDNATFFIKMKKIDAPTHWVEDQLHKNLDSGWTTVGEVRWWHREVNVKLPPNLNSL